MTRVKVCGLTTPAERDAVVAAGADAAGFIVDVPVETHRAIDAATAMSLVEGLPPFVTSVLVTMADEADDVRTLCERVGPDAVQLHGTPSPALVADVGRATGRPVIAAIEPSIAAARRCARVADALVIDTPTDTGRGGTGRPHDWAMSAAIAGAVDVPVVLAGGLAPTNVVEAIVRVDPYAVDVASGVEDARGRTDPATVRDFVRATATDRETVRSPLTCDILGGRP